MSRYKVYPTCMLFLLLPLLIVSHTHPVTSDGTNPGIPVGRLTSGISSRISSSSSIRLLLVRFGSHSFPLDVIHADPVGLAQLIARDVLQYPVKQLYSLGGMIPMADDGVNALSPTRRQAAFLKGVASEEMSNEYYVLFYGGLMNQTTDSPGSSCHNHALVFEMGPLKDDWTKTCAVDWS